MVISIAEYAKTPEIKEYIKQSDYIRNETLNRCYEMDGYEKLSTAGKRKIYDTVRETVINEMEARKNGI